MLKAVPNKNAGFIILFTSIFILFYFMRSLSISFYFIIFFTNRFNGFYLCFWFLLLFSFIWIGGQFPVDNFLSYGRILTLHYYYLLICILFSPSFIVRSLRLRSSVTHGSLHSAFRSLRSLRGSLRSPLRSLRSPRMIETFMNDPFREVKVESSQGERNGKG